MKIPETEKYKFIAKAIIIVGLAAISLYGGMHGGYGDGWGILSVLILFTL